MLPLKLFKANNRSVEQLSIDLSFSIGAHNSDVVSSRLLKDFFGLDDSLVDKIGKDLRASMRESTQSKEHLVIPIKAGFRLLKNECPQHNLNFYDFSIISDSKYGFEEFEDPYSTKSMKLWKMLKKQFEKTVSQNWSVDVELIRMSWEINPMMITLRLSKANRDNITEKEKAEVNDIIHKNRFCNLAKFSSIAEGKNDTTQVISRFQSTFWVKMFRSFGYMEGHDVMLCQLMKRQLQNYETLGDWCKNDTIKGNRQEILCPRSQYLLYTSTCFILRKGLYFYFLLN